MEDRPVYSYIPKNLDATGGLFGGAVDTRRLIEGIIGALIAVILYRILSIFFHSENVLYVCAIIGIALFAACLAGGNGEPLSIFLLNFINYEKRRIFVTLRPPMPDFEGEKKRAASDGGPSLEERIMSRIKSVRTSRKREDRK